MRLLLTARYPVGGIRTFFRYVYGQDCFADLQMDLVAPDEGNALRTFFENYLPPGRIELITVGSSHSALLKGIYRQLRQRDYALVHSHGFTAGLFTEIARTGQRVPHLMTAHDVFLEEQFQGWEGRLKRVLMSQLFRRMSGIHTVTVDAGENFREFFPRTRPERIHSILHGVDTQFFADGVALDFHESLGIDGNRPLIGFFGRFMAQKGFRDLVDAMRLLVNDEEVVDKPMVLTFGSGGYIREDYAYVREQGLEGYFIQVPKTDNMPGALKGVDLVAMPSRWEACGLLAMEALAAGAPIIGTHCVGLNEVLRHTPAEVISPRNKNQLAQAIKKMLKESPVREFRSYQTTAIRRFDVGYPARELRKLCSALAEQ